MAKQSNLVDDYVHQFPPAVMARLQRVRELISQHLPDAEERISYKIPAYHQNGYIVYFAGYDSFISLYPVHGLPDNVAARVQPYVSGRATMRLAHNDPLPEKLIIDVVNVLYHKNRQRHLTKRKS